MKIPFISALVTSIMALFCSPQKAPPPPEPTLLDEFEAFKGPIFIKAQKGPVKYCGGYFGWINTSGGSIDLNLVTVTNGLTTDQELFAECSNLPRLTIGKGAWIQNSVVKGEASVGTKTQGNLTVKDTFFEGPVTVNGNVLAERAHFDASIEAYSSIICLSKSETGPIEVRRVKNCPRPIVHLCDNTLIDGNIWFESENGIVIVDETSYVNGGVIGGTVVME